MAWAKALLPWLFFFIVSQCPKWPHSSVCRHIDCVSSPSGYRFYKRSGFFILFTVIIPTPATQKECNEWWTNNRRKGERWRLLNLYFDSLVRSYIIQLLPNALCNKNTPNLSDLSRHVFISQIRGWPEGFRAVSSPRLGWVEISPTSVAPQGG